MRNQPDKSFACRHRRTAKVVASVLGFSLAALANAAQAAEQYFAGDGSLFTASKYSTSPTGPFTSAFTSGNVIGFGVANGTGTGGTVTVGGFDALQSFTLTAVTGTISNVNNGVVNISVAAGMTLDFSTESFTTSATAGYTYSGNTTGVLALAGGAYGGGFTLNSGTVILRGVNALGGAATNTLTINGGIIAASNSSRDLTGKYGGGITIGGDFQLGALAANSPLANDTGSLTFSNNMALGTPAAGTRTITLGNKGIQTLGGIISGTSGLTFAAVSGAGSTVAGNGVIAITGTTNTFTGAININGPEVTFAGDGSLGNTANTINIEGGRLTLTASATITAARGIQIGSTAGTSISAKGSSTVITYNGVIADLNGETGTFAKQGGGTLALGGVSTYSGDTSINNGTLQLTTANNRLPTGTTVNVGQVASVNVGTLDLNGFNQQVAGLNSTTGTNTITTAKNTVTSAGAATLTLGGSGTYVFGDGSAANSGVLTGALAVSKTGSGTQTFGDANTYTGGTTINGGKLLVASAATVSATGTGAVSVGAAGTLASTAGAPGTAGTGTITGLVTTAAGTSVIAPGATAAANTGTVGALTLAGGLNIANGATIPFDLGAAASTSDLITISGGTFTGGTAAGSVLFNFNTTQTAGTYDLISYANATASGVDLSDFAATGANGNFSFNGNELDFTITAVPEPATIFGGVLLIGALGWNQRRRLLERFAARRVAA